MSFNPVTILSLSAYVIPPQPLCYHSQPMTFHPHHYSLTPSLCISTPTTIPSLPAYVFPSKPIFFPHFARLPLCQTGKSKSDEISKFVDVTWIWLDLQVTQIPWLLITVTIITWKTWQVTEIIWLLIPVAIITSGMWQATEMLLLLINFNAIDDQNMR